MLCYATMYGAFKNLQKTVWIWQICNYRFVGAVLFYGLCFMPLNWNLSFFWGTPLFYSVSSFGAIFDPFLYTKLFFFSLILTIGSYNHTKYTVISQLKTCVTDYYLIVTPQSGLQVPKHRPPPRHNVLRFFQEKNILKTRPFQGLTKTPQFEESKSHMEEAGTIQNIWKTIHTGSSKARHQELAPHILGSHALPFHAIEGTVSLEGDVVPAKGRNKPWTNIFRRCSPWKNIFFTISPRDIRNTFALNCSPFGKNIGCHQWNRFVLGVSSKISYNFLAMDRYGYETKRFR